MRCWRCSGCSAALWCRRNANGRRRCGRDHRGRCVSPSATIIIALGVSLLLVQLLLGDDIPPDIESETAAAIMLPGGVIANPGATNVAVWVGEPVDVWFDDMNWKGWYDADISAIEPSKEKGPGSTVRLTYTDGSEDSTTLGMVGGVPPALVIRARYGAQWVGRDVELWDPGLLLSGRWARVEIVGHDPLKVPPTHWLVRDGGSLDPNGNLSAHAVRWTPHRSKPPPPPRSLPGSDWTGIEMDVYSLTDKAWQPVRIQDFDPETRLYNGLFAGFGWTESVNLATTQFRVSEAFDAGGAATLRDGGQRGQIAAVTAYKLHREPGVDARAGARMPMPDDNPDPGVGVAARLGVPDLGPSCIELGPSLFGLLKDGEVCGKNVDHFDFVRLCGVADS